MVTGWGRNISSLSEETAPFVNILQEVTLPITSWATCNTFINSLLGQEDSEINYVGYLCVGDGQEKGACFGDSGGPVIVQKQGQTRSVAADVMLSHVEMLINTFYRWTLAGSVACKI